MLYPQDKPTYPQKVQITFKPVSTNQKSYPHTVHKKPILLRELQK